MANHAISTSNVHAFPAIEAGHRLTPARLQHQGRNVVVHVPCPEWCEDDHVSNFQHFAEDIDHWGPSVPSWDTDSIDKPGQQVLALDARLHADPMATDPRLSATHVLVGNENVEAYLTPGMAEQAADEMIAFAAQLRHLARQARQFNDRTARPEHRGQADEALRRVREGRTA